MSFLADVVAGKAKPEDIDDYIERWHLNSHGASLYDELGMTWEQYGRWARRPSALDGIIEQYRNQGETTQP